MRTFSQQPTSISISWFRKMPEAHIAYNVSWQRIWGRKKIQDAWDPTLCKVQDTPRSTGVVYTVIPAHRNGPRKTVHRTLLRPHHRQVQPRLDTIPIIQTDLIPAEIPLNHKMKKRNSLWRDNVPTLCWTQHLQNTLSVWTPQTNQKPVNPQLQKFPLSDHRSASAQCRTWGCWTCRFSTSSSRVRQGDDPGTLHQDNSRTAL